MEDTQIMEIWDLFIEHVPDKSKDIIANQYVEYLINQDIELEVLESLIGNDDYLDDAIEEALEEEAYYQDDEDLYNDGDD